MHHLVIFIQTNKMHKILVIRLYFHYSLYMFRTVLDLPVTSQQPDVSAYTKYDVHLIKGPSWRWTDTVRNMTIKCNHKNFFASGWFIYIMLGVFCMLHKFCSITWISRLFHQCQLDAPAPTVDVQYTEHILLNFAIIWNLAQNFIEEK